MSILFIRIICCGHYNGITLNTLPVRNGRSASLPRNTARGVHGDLQRSRYPLLDVGHLEINEVDGGHLAKNRKCCGRWHGQILFSNHRTALCVSWCSSHDQTRGQNVSVLADDSDGCICDVTALNAPCSLQALSIRIPNSKERTCTCSLYTWSRNRWTVHSRQTLLHFSMQ